MSVLMPELEERGVDAVLPQSNEAGLRAEGSTRGSAPLLLGLGAQFPLPE